MGQLLNEMVSPHFYGLSIISNKVVRSAGAVIAFNFQWFGTWSMLGLASRGSVDITCLFIIHFTFGV